MQRLAWTTTTMRERGWVDCVVDGAERRPRGAVLGVLPGEGIGPEVVDAALGVLRRLERAGGRPVEIEVGGAIGRDAERAAGTPLSDEVAGFCEQIFDRGGAILNGPGGGRYVYDLRARFDLFLKISPIQVRNGLPGASPLRPETVDGVDMLVVRENIGGVYHGRSENGSGPKGGRRVRHAFSYEEADVRRFLGAAARIARSRNGALTVVTKEAGVPEVSRLWRECATEAAEAHQVSCSLIDVDLVAYQLVRRPGEFDVLAAPNLYGDVLGDLAAALVGSRGVSYSGNYAPRGEAVYQTNHGAAYDIAGTDTANPVGQILSLAMLLRESLGLRREADAVEEGIRRAWDRGWRTTDVDDGMGRVVGTAEMGKLVADAAADHLAATLDAA